MKKLFYIGVIGLSVFEILNVYFIMPMPGSQEMNSVALAYFLYSWRWVFRILFGIMILAGAGATFRAKRKWIAVILLLLAVFISWVFNFKMTAEKMFLQVKSLEMKPKSGNVLAGDRLVIGVAHNGEASAYPIEFLAYHHQVRDVVGGKQVMVTYCSVCRTGRVYEPVVDGKQETFRLVGMDHFNAMFEDENSGSWWRQSNGEAVTGKLKGRKLPEVPSMQVTVDKWFELFPNGKIMQADPAFVAVYDSAGKYEKGKSKGSLTRTDSLSWKHKSWVAGVQSGNSSKAYDWNVLKKQRIINDTIGQLPIVLILSSDGQSFAAYERPSGEMFTVRNDTLYSSNDTFDFSGKNVNQSNHQLKVLNAYQEFWHSWLTFNPGTSRYPAD